MIDPESRPHWPVPTGPPVAGVEPPSGLAPPDGAPFNPTRPDPASGGGFDVAQQRWGMWDIALGLPFILVWAVLGLVAGLLVNGFDDLTTAVEAPAVIALGAIGQQVGMAAWPLIVSRWKGLGPVKDWGFRFTWADLVIGPALGIAMAIAGAGVSYLMAASLGVLESEDISNTNILTDNQESAWIWVIVFVTVIGAPFSEELFFRGLALGSIQKRAGWPIGVIGSTILFVLPHFTGAGWRETSVLLATLTVVAVSLAFMVRLTSRLGTAIVAHATFNSLSVFALLVLN